MIAIRSGEDAGVLGITDLPTYVLGTIAIILLPGPNSIFVLSTAARRGVPAGYRAAGGVFLGDTVLMVLSAAGVASLLRAYPPLFTVIKYAGAGYLFFIGIGMLRGAWWRWRDRRPSAGQGPPTTVEQARTEPARTEQARAMAPPPDVAASPFRRALVVSLLNPKAILFFISFFIQFVDPGYPYPVVSFLVLGAIAQVVSAAYLSMLIFMGTFLAVQFRRRRRLSASVITGLGALFLGFGVKLATASL